MSYSKNPHYNKPNNKMHLFNIEESELVDSTRKYSQQYQQQQQQQQYGQLTINTDLANMNHMNNIDSNNTTNTQINTHRRHYSQNEIDSLMNNRNGNFEPLTPNNLNQKSASNTLLQIPGQTNNSNNVSANTSNNTNNNHNNNQNHVSFCTNLKNDIQDSYIAASSVNRESQYVSQINQDELYTQRSVSIFNPGESETFETEYNANMYNFQSRKKLVNYRIARNINGFIESLKKYSILKSLTTLKENQIDIIGDLSFSTLKNSFIKVAISKKRTSKYTWFERFINFIDAFKVFNPHSIVFLIWGFIHTFLSVPAVFLMPIEVISGGQYSMKEYNVWPRYLQVYLGVLVIDIFIQFNSAYYDKGRIVEGRRAILKRYMKWGFITDIACVISILEQYNTNNYDFQAFIFLKIKIAFELIERITSIYIYNKKIYNCLRLFHLFVLSMVICHIFACLYWALATIQDITGSEGVTWVELHLNQKPGQIEWQRIYLYSFYFSCTTMSTVGYGDIVPSTNYEISFAIFSMLFSSAIFGYVLSYIGDIILDMNREHEIYKKEIHLTSRYLEKMMVSQELKLEVINYISYKFKTDNAISLEDQMYVVQKIPKALKQKIKMESNLKLLAKINLFDNFSQKTKEKLAMKLEEVNLQENQQLYKKGDLDDNACFYYIVAGEVEIQKENFSKIQTLTKDCLLGEESFFTGNEREFTAVTNQRSITYQLSRQEFLDVISYNQQDYELYCLMRDKLLFPNNKPTKNIITKKCQCCNSYNHSILNCHWAHFLPDRTKVVLQYNYSVPHTVASKDFSFKRKMKRQRFSSLEQIQLIKLNAEEFMEDNYGYSENSLVSESEFITQDDINELIEGYREEEDSENENEGNSPTQSKRQKKKRKSSTLRLLSRRFSKAVTSSQILNSLATPLMKTKFLLDKSIIQLKKSNQLLKEKNPSSSHNNLKQNSIKNQLVNSILKDDLIDEEEESKQQNQLKEQKNSDGDSVVKNSKSEKRGGNSQLQPQDIVRIRDKNQTHGTINMTKEQMLQKLMMVRDMKDKIPIQTYKHNYGGVDELEFSVVNDKVCDFQVYCPKYNYSTTIQGILHGLEFYTTRADYLNYFGKYTFFNYKKQEKKSRKKAKRKKMQKGNINNSTVSQFKTTALQRDK